jgi:hypothetical protein
MHVCCAQEQELVCTDSIYGSSCGSSYWHCTNQSTMPASFDKSIRSPGLRVSRSCSDLSSPLQPLLALPAAAAQIRPLARAQPTRAQHTTHTANMRRLSSTPFLSAFIAGVEGREVQLCPRTADLGESGPASRTLGPSPYAQPSSPPSSWSHAPRNCSVVYVHAENESHSCQCFYTPGSGLAGLEANDIAPVRTSSGGARKPAGRRVAPSEESSPRQRRLQRSTGEREGAVHMGAASRI